MTSTSHDPAFEVLSALMLTLEGGDDAWQDFFRIAGRALEADVVIWATATMMPDAEGTSFDCTAGYSAFMELGWMSELMHLHPTTHRLDGNPWQAGDTTSISRRVGGPRGVLRNPWYAQAPLTFGLGSDVGVTCAATACSATVFAAFQNRDRGDLDDSVSDLTNRLAPHLVEYDSLARMLKSRRMLALGRGLDERGPVAVFDLDARGRLVSADRLAQRMLARSNPLRLSEGSIVPTRPEARRPFANAIRSAMSDSRNPAWVGRTYIPDATNLRLTFIAYVCRVPVTTASDAERPALQVFVTPVAPFLGLDVLALAARYRLTERQLEVVGHWFRLRTLTATANVLRCSPKTVWTHLERVRDVVGAPSVAGLCDFLSVAGYVLRSNPYDFVADDGRNSP